MATVTAARQPFAPLNGSRLQNLTSLKNRQNALTSPTKRKAATFDNDDAENVDPVSFLSPKKSKQADGTSHPVDFVKPTNFFLTKAPPSPNDFTLAAAKPVLSPRRVLTARSPAKISTSGISKAPLAHSAPAGRSPTRKRIGILKNRRTSAPFTRIDPPKFSTPSGLGFSIDAALSGTIPSYKARAPVVVEPEPDFSAIPVLHTPQAKESWFFEIYEETEAETATNLMEHGACTLDISSDEESAAREPSDCGKENVPPADDISQTRTRLSEPMVSLKSRVRKRDMDVCDIDRAPLGEMAAEDFYAEGCDGSSIALVLSDTVGEEVEAEQPVEEPIEQPVVPTVDVVAAEEDKKLEIDELMRKDDAESGPKAALLEPIEKAEEGFTLWESGSAHEGEGEA